MKRTAIIMGGFNEWAPLQRVASGNATPPQQRCPPAGASHSRGYPESGYPARDDVAKRDTTSTGRFDHPRFPRIVGTSRI